jgi:nicotinamide-nucleotide amidase
MMDQAELALEIRLGQALSARGWTLAVAESCTGGLVGHRITQVPGSSAYFLGGVISYSNQAKHELLGVALATLDSLGAVSRETALEMAHGAREALHADVGVAITGVAGPGGGSAEKPVGLTWIAVSTPDAEQAQRFVFGGTRSEVKRSASQSALEFCLEKVEAPGG